MFPSPREEGLGLFVRARLRQLAKHAEIAVIAPLPILDYARLGTKQPAPAGFPRHYRDGGLDIHHPRWLYPPGGGWFNAVCLFLAVLPCARRIRRSFPFQLIDAHFAFPDGIAAALLATALRLPFTVTLRGNETMHARYRLRRFWMAWALRRAARVIAVSESLRQFAISLGVDPQRARTIPNGIDAAVYHPRDRAECRARLGMPPDRKTIVSAGHLIEGKGHHRVVGALAALRRRNVDAMLWIVGGQGREVDFEASIRAVVNELGLADSVRFTGAVPAAVVAEYMAAADVFCLASSREGWPNVVNEALACGTPVVATAVGGIPDMLPSEEVGLVVPPSDAQALERALELALTKPWDRQAIAAWGQSRSWEHVAVEVHREFVALLGET